MAMKKSQIYNTLWRSCDELRGGMDASQYKDYVLTLLFMKYVSDKYAGQPYAPIQAPEGGSFADMVKLKGDKEIGDKINKIIARMAEANDLTGAINLADFNNEDKLGRGQEMVDRLSKLVAIFNGLDFRANRASGDDLLGDAYEYLMRHFATESGKSKGQFYTPAEVSRIMAKLIGIGPGTRRDQTLYDPTCGSGSLLLKAADEAPNGITIYGQEMDNSTWALARMNMVLHNQPTAELYLGNSLSNPRLLSPNGGLRTFDFVVANPPFSAKAWTNGVNVAQDPFHRFAYGTPPAKNGDYAFLLHVLTSLKSTGKGAVIMPHGVLFRGNAEAGIRRNLVQRGFIKGIIGLPANLFYGTGIPACIVVLDKERSAERDGIFFVDASRGFMKDGPKNRLREQDIHKIVDVFTRQLEVPGYSRLVGRDEIAANGYNLNIPRYIDSSEPEDLHDLEAHLRGGIPDRDIDALCAYWEVFPALRDGLFAPGDRPGYSRAKVAPHEVKPLILAHPEFRAYAERAACIVRQWQEAHEPMLADLGADAKPKEVIHTLAEDLLRRFDGFALLSKYDAYQGLMDYWEATMQDDVYLVVAEGWRNAARPRVLVEEKEKDQKVKETPDLVVGKTKYKMDLLPPALLVSRFFAEDEAAIAALEAERDAAAQELAEFIEEHGGDEGLLDEAKNDKGEVVKGEVTRRLKAIFAEPDSDEEREALTRCLALMDAEAGLNRRAKAARAALDAEVLGRYATLTEDEIKALAINGKSFASVQCRIDDEVQSLTEALIRRLRELEERYAETLSEIDGRIVALEARAAERLCQITADQLLTGKMRLPGFEGEWEIKRLGEIAEIRIGRTPSRNNPAYWGQGYPWIAIADMKSKVINDTAEQITERAAAMMTPIPAGTLIMSFKLSIGRLAFTGHEMYSNEAICSFSRLQGIAEYFYYALGRVDFSLYGKQAVKGYTLNKESLREILVPYPSADEQRAIAQVLSDMDAEIEALEARVAKTRDIKQGMMQQLLTGRVRLPVPSTPEESPP